MRWLICLILMAGVAQAGTRKNPASTPTISPNPGMYFKEISVTLKSSTPGAVIHYTIDETEPNENSPSYTGKILISSTTRIRAIAIARGYSASEQIEGEFQIENFTKFGIARFGGG